VADKQILVTGSSDAPEGYTVPNTVELIPKAVSCVLDGTGASGDFVPVLEIVSDGGVVVAQSPGSTVTAGGSVEQSWFPRVGGSGGANVAAAEPQWFYAVRSTSLTMGAGAQDTIPWDSLHSSDSTLFSLATNIHANDSVQVARQGVLLVSAYLSPSLLGTDFVMGINLMDQSWGQIGANTQTPELQFNRDGLPGGGTFGPRDIMFTATASVPDKLTAQYHNFDVGSSRVIGQAQMGGFWWPTAAAIS
jgi:hypothetical protein